MPSSICIIYIYMYMYVYIYVYDGITNAMNLGKLREMVRDRKT